METNSQKIAFYGLGNMGASMAINLVKAGFDVSVFDLVNVQVDKLVAEGARGSKSAVEAASDANIVISMLPAGKHVESLYFSGDSSDKRVIDVVQQNTLFIDCSTIEANTSKSLHAQLAEHGYRFVDAPVSGGVAGAAAGTLTFIVGGDAKDFDVAQPILDKMGKHIFHAGDVGAGQAAKICNNMLLSILMAGTSEALNLAIANGLDPKVMSQIMLQSSGRNWTLELYNPCPDVMPNVPSSNDYNGGFMVDLMNKDLGLALDNASDKSAITPMGALAKSLYQKHAQQGYGSKDFSSIFEAFKTTKKGHKVKQY
jgi:3-hydroxyisobutyrate dehydrogenase